MYSFSSRIYVISAARPLAPFGFLGSFGSSSPVPAASPPLLLFFNIERSIFR